MLFLSNYDIFLIKQNFQTFCVTKVSKMDAIVSSSGSESTSDWIKPVKRRSEIWKKLLIHEGTQICCNMYNKVHNYCIFYSSNWLLNLQ